MYVDSDYNLNQKRVKNGLKKVYEIKLVHDVNCINVLAVHQYIVLLILQVCVIFKNILCDKFRTSVFNPHS